MAQYGYGGRSNPYDQRGPAPNNGYNAAQQSQNAPYGGGYESQPYEGGYDSQQYGSGQTYGAAPVPYGSNTRYNSAQPAMGRDNYGSNVEMEPLAPNGSTFDRQHDPNATLNKCKQIDKDIGLTRNKVEEIRLFQQRSLQTVDSTAQLEINKKLDQLSSETMQSYRNLAHRVRAIKQQPDSGSPRNAPQVGKIDRDLKRALQDYRMLDSEFEGKLRGQMARQYRIVNPNASPEEVDRVVSDTSNTQIFSEALMQSDRRGQSQSALSAVKDRHAAIQKIESQMIELADLFNQMDALVVQQEEAVTVIEQKGEEVVENIQGGNEHLVKGVELAKARNRKKWWCLLICILILVVVGVIIAVYFLVIRPHNNPTKRSLSNALQARGLVTESLTWIPRGRSILPSTPPVPAFE